MALESVGFRLNMRRYIDHAGKTRHTSTVMMRPLIYEGRMNDSVLIRIATPEDAAQVAFVLHESFAEYRDSYTAEAFAATTPAGDVVLNRMKEGPVWVALLGDTVVGTASAVERGEDLYIRGMAVLPAGRGLGIGRLLLKQIEDYACQHNHRRLTLSTTPFLYSAIRLYEHFGFARSEEGSDTLFGTPLFTMVKNLGVRSTA